jgi:CheY-like chemotaxis protein
MAEDDPLMGRMYERAFRLGGHELTLAHDGAEALEVVTTMSPQPSVIMLDVMMPKMSGFDVLAKIKHDNTLKHIPVVMLTNLAGKEDAEKAIAMGAYKYLVKSSYNPKQIVEEISHIAASGK